MDNGDLSTAGSALADTAMSVCSASEGVAGVGAVATAATTLAVAAAAVTALASDGDGTHDQAPQTSNDAEDDSQQPALTSTGRPVRAARLAAAAAAAASKRAEIEASNRAKGVRRTPARKASTSKPKPAAKKGTVDDDAAKASASGAAGPFALVPSQPARKLPSQQLSDADRPHGYVPASDSSAMVFYPHSAQGFMSSYRPVAGGHDDMLSGGSLLSSYSQQVHNPQAIAALRNLKASTPPQRNSSASTLSSPPSFNTTDAQLAGSSMALDENGDDVDADAAEDAEHIPLGIMGAYGTPYGHLGRMNDGRIVQLYPPVERASQACELCRRRKARCSGGVQCERCKKGNQVCVYAQIDRTRGVKETKPHDQLLADSAASKLALDARVSTPPTQVSDGATPDQGGHKSPGKTMSSIAARGRGKKAALGLQTASTRAARPPPRSAGIDASSFLGARDIAPMPHTAHGGYFTGLEGFASPSVGAKEHAQTSSFSAVGANEAPMYSPMQQASGGYVHDAGFATASQQHSQRQHQENSQHHLQQAHYQQQRQQQQQQSMAAPTSTRPLLMQQRHSWQSPSSSSGQQHSYYATSTGYERLDNSGYYYQAQQPQQPQQQPQHQQQQQQVQEHAPQQTHTQANNYQYSTSTHVPSQTPTSSTSNLAHIYNAQPHRGYASSSVAQQPYQHAAPQYGAESLSAGNPLPARPHLGGSSHVGHHDQGHASHSQSHGSTAADGGPATFEQLETTTTSSGRGYRDFVLASAP